jgi:pimeloyl-ACP methyl ester carboxylesterase
MGLMPVSKHIRDARPERLETFKSDAVKARYLTAYDGLMRKWPVPYEERDAPTRFGVTHVVVSGPPDAPPLVLLHAMLATATVWRPNVEGLSRHFRVYAVDILGQYGKSISSKAIGSRRQLADWMCDLFDALGITRASLVGNSYGAFVALNQAALAPERVDRCVMINPAGVFASVLPIFLRMLLRRSLSALRPAAQRPRLTVAATLGRNVQLGPDEQEWADLVSLVWTEDMRINAAFPRVLSSAELRAIRCPALLLIGDNDLMYEPQKILKRAQKRMPLLEAAIVPNAYHIAAMAQPNEINARIIRFLGPATWFTERASC